ncbi:MAG: ComF family protein [Caldimonas sp.]
MLAPRRPAATATSSPAGALRLPSLCAICHGWGQDRVCAACLSRYATPVPRCSRCALPVPPAAPVCGACLAQAPAFDAAVACVDYRAPWDQLIADFKFHDALDLAPVFAAAIAGAVASRAANGDPETLLPELVLPVPLGAGRLRERGYNQAWELAQRVARRLGLAADARLLLRLRETKHQLALPPEQRAGNVRGAFAVEPRRRAEVAGRRVALVDDVMTTASTAGEASRVLKQAGAASVAVWVFARTPPPGED